MATILGIEIQGDVVRGVVVRTAFRSAQIVRYLETPIVAAQPAPPIAHAYAVQAPTSDAFPSALPPGEAPFALGHLQPQAASPESVPEGTTASGEHDRASIAPSDPVAAAVRTLLRSAGVPGTATIAIYPGRDVSLRRIALPAAAAKKLEELLPYEVEAVVPFDAEHSVLDHQPIETAEGELRVLVAVAPRDKVHARLEELAALGVDPTELAPGAAALDGLVHFVPEVAGDKLSLVVNLGPHHTDVCALRRGHVELARTITVGARDLSSTAAGPFTPATITGGGAERFSRELRQTLMAIRLATGVEPEAFWLGGEVQDPALAPWLAEVFGALPVPLPLPAATPAPGVTEEPQSPEQRARWAMCVALGARVVGRGKRLDLRKGDLAQQRAVGAIRRYVPLVAACATAVFCAFLFSSYARWSVLDSRREALEAQLARVTAERLGEETTSPTRARTLLERGSQRVDPLPRFTALDALGAISAAVPAEVEHDVTRLHIDLGDSRSGGHFEMQATVQTIEDHTRVVQALSQNACFREVELLSSTQSTGDRRMYRVEGDILCPGDEPREEASSRRRGARGAGSGSGARRTGGT